MWQVEDTCPPRDSVPNPRESSLTGWAYDSHVPMVQPAVAKRKSPVVPTELLGAPTVERSESSLWTIADICAQEGTVEGKRKQVGGPSVFGTEGLQGSLSPDDGVAGGPAGP